MLRSLPHLLILLLAAGLAMAGSTPPAYAQRDPIPPGSPVRIHFAGGTVEDYVREITQQTDDVQVVLSERAKQLEVEPVELHNVDAEAAMQVLQALVPNLVFRPFGGRPRIFHIDSRPSRVELRVFPVQSMMAGFNDSRTSPAATLLSALEAALEMMLSSEALPKPRIKLHPDTGLLLFSGTPEQLAVVEQVVSQMEEMPRRAVSAPAEAEAIQRLISEIAMLRAKENELRQTQEALQQQLAELQERLERMGDRPQRGGSLPPAGQLPRGARGAEGDGQPRERRN